MIYMFKISKYEEDKSKMCLLLEFIDIINVRMSFLFLLWNTENIGLDFCTQKGAQKRFFII